MVDDIYRKTNIEATFNSVLNHDSVAETSKKYSDYVLKPNTKK